MPIPSPRPRTRRRPRRARLCLEPLEGRSLLSGQVTEFPVPDPSGDLGWIVGTPDGSFWFREGSGWSVEDSTIGRFNPASGDFSRQGFNPMRGDIRAVSIGPATIGSDGNLDVVTIRKHIYDDFLQIGGDSSPWSPGRSHWIQYRVQKDQVQIFHVTPDGHSSFDQIGQSVFGESVDTSKSAVPYPNRRSGLFPNDITTGPLGSFWFVDADQSLIGLDGPGAHQTATFRLPEGSRPQGISPGPDGALWFTEAGSNKIGRITTDGNITQFALPTANASPDAITTGPDGALWFTETAAGQVGRITTDGTVTEFALPTADTKPTAIVAAPDGNLYVLESGPDRLARVTTSGQVAEVPLPTDHPGLAGLTIGADGDLWFTEAGPQRIARLELAAMPPSGGLDPSSDSGLSDADGVTSDRTPTFSGQAGPGDLVRVFAQHAGAMTLTPIAGTVADASGHWQATSGVTLPDAAYFVYALANRTSDGAAIARPLPVGQDGLLHVDTHGPRVVDAALLPRAGLARITYLDAQGNLATSSLPRRGYHATVRDRPRMAGPVRNSGNGTAATALIPLTISPFSRGLLRLSIDSTTITDRAGNTLQSAGSGPLEVDFAFDGERAWLAHRTRRGRAVQP